jgi:hypothetical protein
LARLDFSGSFATTGEAALFFLLGPTAHLFQHGLVECIGSRGGGAAIGI